MRWLLCNLHSMLSLFTSLLKELSREDTHHSHPTSQLRYQTCFLRCLRETLPRDHPFINFWKPHVLRIVSSSSFSRTCSRMSSLTPYSTTRMYLKSSRRSRLWRRQKRNKKPKKIRCKLPWLPRISISLQKATWINTKMQPSLTMPIRSMLQVSIRTRLTMMLLPRLRQLTKVAAKKTEMTRTILTPQLWLRTLRPLRIMASMRKSMAMETRKRWLTLHLATSKHLLLTWLPSLVRMLSSRASKLLRQTKVLFSKTMERKL